MANKRTKPLPSRAYILSQIEYFPETGIFVWKNSGYRKIKGKIAGCFKQSDGYHYIRIDGVLLLAHRLAWFISYGQWPDKYIDHINRVRNDNRLHNLRLADEFQNSWNQKVQKRNKSGFRGVFWDKQSEGWRAIIYANGRQNYLGTFSSAKEAGKAYIKAAKIRFGEYAPL